GEVAGLREHGGIEVSVQPLVYRSIQLRVLAVCRRSLARISKIDDVLPVADRQRQTRLEDRDAINLPSADGEIGVTRNAGQKVPPSTKGKVIVGTDHQALRNVLCRDRPFSGAVVEILFCARRPKEGHGLGNVVDQLTRRQADLRAQSFAESLGYAQRKGMVQRVALRFAERAHTRVLRERPQKLAITDEWLVEQRLRVIGKHIIERIGDTIGAQ